mgnify:CR=1 FL=1
MLIKPTPDVYPDFANIPEELAKLPRWGLWRTQKRGTLNKDGIQEWTKIPVDSYHRNIKANEPDKWFTLKDVQAAFSEDKFAGIGFNLTNSEVAAIDIDPEPGHTVGDIAEAVPELKAVLESSYIETSPSGKGVHVWFTGQLPDEMQAIKQKQKVFNSDGEALGEIEHYDGRDTRYLTFTGRGTKKRPLTAAAAQVKSLAGAIIPKTSKTSQNVSQGHSGDAAFTTQAASNTQPGSSPQWEQYDGPITQDMVFNAMEHSSTGQRTRKFLDADPSAAGYMQDTDGHYSSAIESVMNDLAFYTHDDAALMDSIFRGSNLYQTAAAKWDQKHRSDGATYGQMTIEKAINSPHNQYQYKQQAPGVSGGNPGTYQPQAGTVQSRGDAQDVEAIARQQQARRFIGNLDMDTATIDEIPSMYQPYVTQDERKAMYLNTSPAKHLDYFEGLLDGSVGGEAPVPTGFKQLDKQLDGGLFAGLYIIGAISSLGKTTFMLQLADQVAKGGHDVQLFSLEMNRHEIMAKTISRLTYLQTETDNQTESNALTVHGILDARRYNGYTDALGETHPGYKPYQLLLLDEAQRSYKKFAGRINIHEGMGNIGVQEVREAVEGYIDATGNKPVVIIDYLQILAPADPRSTDKQNTDRAVLELKRLSRDYGIPVFAISSFNRENYSTAVSMASFKESGAVEYSSDVLLGLQVEGMQAGTADKVKSSNRQLVEDNKGQKDRRIELVILKNRNGGTGGKIPFIYHSWYNYYWENDGTSQRYPLNGSGYKAKGADGKDSKFI